ncbi:four helix bundle suffix domain-containing protein [Geoalkalibacter halelectricus]|uniref:Four helix bundle suffix domain-containing protein n=1 Tax=Geoalkalibacter halelectricus TaxID=2847045 RepID=A0ABY5ZUE6_9BACT|nr:four helix bundle suffix domain-containing protein [Geoalkalibacter halelectricus]MDO3377697.1 four helix bundle suffix domain-containing protein [Geoalkalibacter halelectricus]UWZ81485.1 four helix bundle suffix domain-containing protein [Geoalkalibacter halelectricus]
MSQGFIPPHGGYRNLLSYRKAEIVYDATVWFCNRYVDRRSRTHDQMVQAARSGKQNIIEGSQASGTSKETEIKLTNVARASLEELLADYCDFLRVRGKPRWEKDSKEAVYVRRLGRQKPGTDRTNGTDGKRTLPESHPSPESYATYKPFIETRPPEVVANIIICLIHQANYLLDRQLSQLETAFLQEGGLRERMTRARLQERNRQRS